MLFRPDQLSQSDGSVSIQLVYNLTVVLVPGAGSVKCSFCIKRVPKEKLMQGKDLMPGSGWLLRILHPQLMHVHCSANTAHGLWLKYLRCEAMKEKTQLADARARVTPENVASTAV